MNQDLALLRNTLHQILSNAPQQHGFFYAQVLMQVYSMQDQENNASTNKVLVHTNSESTTIGQYTIPNIDPKKINYDKVKSFYSTYTG